MEKNMDRSRVNGLWALVLFFVLSAFGGVSSASTQSDYVLYDDFEDGVLNLDLWAPWGSYHEETGQAALGTDGSIQTTKKLIGMSAALKAYRNVRAVGDSVNVHLMTVTPTGDVVAVAEHINRVEPLNPADPPIIVSKVECVWYEGGITYPPYIHHIDLSPAQWDQTYVFGLEYTPAGSILVMVNGTVVYSFPDIPGAADAYSQGGAVFKIQAGSPGEGDVRAEIYDVYAKVATPPVASFKWQKVVEPGYKGGRTMDVKHRVGAIIRFDPSESFSPMGEIIMYIWDFDNGITIITDSPNVYNMKFEEARVYHVRLTVTNNNGLTHTFEETIDLNLKEI
jgi:hypothetical protein